MTKRALQHLTLFFTTVLVLAACESINLNQTNEPPEMRARTLVDSSRDALITLAEDQQVGALFLKEFRKPETIGIIITPNMVKGGLFLGGSGGSGVVLARAENGEWSYPSFIQQGSGSFGVQIGFQAAKTITLLSSMEQLQAMLDGSPIAGGEVGGSVIDEGAGFNFAGATDLSAPLRTFAVSRGAYVGADAKLGGIWTDKVLNTSFYGDTQAMPTEIVLRARYKNALADNLRNTLLQYYSGP